MGATKVFFWNKAFHHLESIRDEKADIAAVIIRKRVKRFIVYRSNIRLLACIQIQAGARMLLAISLYKKMTTKLSNVYSSSPPMVYQFDQQQQNQGRLEPPVSFSLNPSPPITSKLKFKVNKVTTIL
mmetsp:Transcript_16707/g.19243  ORF Transcript_16707/g.19243 Transcript_16707/m.19243 type:complete len:127 (+) Transcript_16707:99-479(+)